ncbi:MAG: DUF1810 domain-containing protein [Lactobacillaceae bacterium]|jgi:uncharacterized protein (DUF1810 family)|nr:DUF1810 domain-containing protein [Lactobacillaceae bacterium]
MNPKAIHEVRRFLDAQDADDSYLTAISELKLGQKATHWMWWVFPQLASLGKSERAKYYGIKNRMEAARYLADDNLAARLEEATKVLLALPTNDPVAVMGAVDAEKLRSSWTLFEAVANPADLYTAGLDKYFAGQADVKTLQAL